MTGDLSPKIKNGIPLPEKARGRPRGERWAFLDHMAMGECAIFDDFGSKEEERKFRKHVGSIISNRYPPDAKRGFAVRTIGPPDFDEEGIGIWRTK